MFAGPRCWKNRVRRTGQVLRREAITPVQGVSGNRIVLFLDPAKRDLLWLKQFFGGQVPTDSGGDREEDEGKVFSGLRFDVGLGCESRGGFWG